MSSEELILLKKAKNGDIESFENLISSYQHKGYNIAFRMLLNEEDAKDALQDSFIKVFKSLNKFKEDSSFYTWLYRIIVNTCNDYLKKRKRDSKVTSIVKYYDSEEGEETDIVDSNPLPEELYLSKEKAKDILKALEKLSVEHKEIIILRDLQHFSYEEISSILDCSIGTVKSRLNRARFKLKDIMLKKVEQIDDFEVKL